MGEATIALVREATTALAMRDLERFERLCHPDVELDWSRRLLDAEVLRGFGDLRRFFAEVDGIFEEVVFEEDEVIDLGDDVLVVSTARFRGRASGVEVTAHGANLWTVREGKIARFRFFQSKADALEDLGRKSANVGGAGGA
jgi:ketosteroid isomerase-like protein